MARPPPLPAATDARYGPARDAVHAVLKEALSGLGGAALHTTLVRQMQHGPVKRD